MGQLKKDNKKNEIVLKKDELLTLFMTSVLVLVVVLMGYVLLNTMQIEKSERMLLTTSESGFTEENLNLLVRFPTIWTLAETDTAHTASVVLESSGGGKFDIEVHTLVEEVVPLLLVEEKGTEGYNRFMSLSFMGDIGLSGKDLEEELSRALEVEVSTSEIKNFEVTTSNVDADGAIYLEAKCESNGREIYYTQYTRKIGKNLASATMGSNLKDIDRYDKVSNLVKNIIKR